MTTETLPPTIAQTMHATHVQDVEIPSRDGFLVLAIHLTLTLAGLFGAWMLGGILGIVAAVLTFLVSLFMMGYYTLEPNTTAVHTFFGRYVGTVSTTGFRWNNPLYFTKIISMRVENFESKELKVNDLDGNPIMISAVVVWRARDAATAIFSVDNYEQFISIQTESALRSLASSYSYDSHADGKMSLRESQDEIAEKLREEIQTRARMAGLEIIEARLNKLSYASEIAGAMLQRQQAQAVVAARTLIVEGAVGMVQLALDKLKADNVVELDDERKAQMVSNLLVVLCGDRSVSPVVNAGSIHS